jgi:hypothetical protein
MKIAASNDAVGPANAVTVKTNSFRTSFGTALETAKAEPTDAAGKLDVYVHLSPAEKMRGSVMKTMGLTDKDIDKMPPAEQQEAIARIAAQLKTKLAAEALQDPGAAPMTSYAGMRL